ncbi:ABC transporter ATP-binding protein [Candidatus Contubernalis alkaliaceticus]|uniref:ABC transporter ATP-binding protein n=1 Tax=Candidatus Contubernalis alkaliaceticus TaxID=338645 RepID=UPI001F4C06E4|nr:ABC transporter ATP-binding protein [Candidatus Contubernalis alkalaceticus]UNC93002.1 ABC transporter ATP-binding protein [Candidatus Contubernalis alkalaceticus]
MSVEIANTVGINRLEAGTSQEKETFLLEVVNLFKHYSQDSLFSEKQEKVRAVDGVSLQIREGETLGLVGESGCGKSTLGRLILRLEESTSGSIYYSGEDITQYRGEGLRQWRKNVQVIFQDAYASLNPRMKVEQIIGEPLYNYKKGSFTQRRQQVERLLKDVGLEPEHRGRYPHEFSGGQRQRIAIARALALNPSVIVCDESVASLDVSIQAQVLNLLKKLRNDYQLSYLFISHDLAAVKYISHQVAVMYLGKIVEVLDSQRLVEEALHPYTRSLLAAVPKPDPGEKANVEQIIRGEPPNPIFPPQGCRFHPRCPQVKEVCSREEPLLLKIGERHWKACHLVF